MKLNETQFKEYLKKQVINEVSKQTELNRLRRFIANTPECNGFYTDNSWENVYAALDKIGEYLDDIEVSVKDGGYGNYDKSDNMPRSKTWHFEGCKNGVPVKGYLVAAAAGTMDDPFGRYDITVIVN